MATRTIISTGQVKGKHTRFMPGHYPRYKREMAYRNAVRQAYTAEPEHQTCACGCGRVFKVASGTPPSRTRSYVKGHNDSTLNRKGPVYHKFQKRWLVYCRDGTTEFWARIVYQNYLGGRRIPQGSIVHHKNEDGCDDRIENLELIRSRAEHACIHQSIPVILSKERQRVRFNSTQEASVFLGGHPNSINANVSRGINTYKGWRITYMREPVIHIFGHRDYDGVASSAILASFLRRKNKRRRIKLHTVNYDASDWQKEILPKNSFVLDFLYNPTAVFHADHHLSSMKDVAEVSKYTRLQLLDVQRKSCAMLLFEYLKRLGKQDWDPAPWIHLAWWADIIDSGGYSSAEQVILSQEPALKIRQALMDRDVDPVGVVESLLEFRGNLELTAHRYQKAWQKRRKKIEHAVRGYPKLMKIINDVGYIDLTKTYCPKDKYLAFHLRPDLSYCVTISGWNGDWQVGAGINPWKEVENPVNLAELAQKYEGGGHQGVMGINSKDPGRVQKIGIEVFSALAYRSQRGGAE